MLIALLKGLGSGAGMCLMLGPVFFTLIQASLSRGMKAVALIAAGVVVSDSIFVCLTLAGTSLIKEMDTYSGIINLLGGCLLLGFGISMIVRARPKEKAADTRPGKLYFFFFKGFFLNALNPMNLVMWMSLGTYVTTVSGYNFQLRAYYFLGCLAGIFVTQLLIGGFAGKLRQLSGNSLVWINRTAGSGLIFFGCRMLLKFL